MNSFFTKLFSRKPSTKRSINCNRVRHQVEGLEDRLALSGVFVQNGDIYIVGNKDSQNIVNIYEESGYYRVVDQIGSISWTSNIPARDVWGGDVIFEGGEYDDYFSNYTFLRVTAYGYGGNDMLTGGHNQDTIDGGWGYDYIWGLGGNDWLYGGWEADGNYMVGGDGDDYLFGSLGSDRMYGGNGNDTLDGYFGNDFLYGENGQDILYGSYDNDYLDGGLDWDRLYGGDGSDSLNGGDDGWADYMSGGAGYDYFQQDWAWKRNWYYGYYYEYNRDSPADYEYGEGFYNF